MTVTFVYISFSCREFLSSGDDHRPGPDPGQPRWRCSLDVIPAAGLVLVLGVYRFISEGGALINLIGNRVATLFIAK